MTATPGPVAAPVGLGAQTGPVSPVVHVDVGRMHTGGLIAALVALLFAVAACGGPGSTAPAGGNPAAPTAAAPAATAAPVPDDGY